MKRRELLGGLGAAGAMSLLPSCTRFAQPDTQGRSRLRIATAKEVARVGISGGGGSETSNVVMLIFDSLVTMDDKLEVVGRLAHTWERISPTEWKFHLRSGVRFTNGELCDAFAVEHSVDYLTGLVPGYTYKNQWGAAWPPRAKALDAETVIITTPVAQAILPRLMCRIAIVPPRASRDPGFANQPVGSGPYKLEEWTRGGGLRLAVNEGYFAGRASIDVLEWSSIPNAAARVIALRAGDIDLVWDLPYEREALIRADPRLKVLEYASIGLAFVVFNFRAKQSPVAHPMVRRAMTFALDAPGIRNALMNGKGEIGLGPAPSQVIGAVDAGGYPARDVAQAMRLLTQAGYPNGIDLVMIYEPGDFQHEEDVCTAIVAQLAECGVRVKFEELPPGGMNERRHRPDWDIAPNSVPGSFTGESPYHYYQLKTQQGFESDRVEHMLDSAAGIEGPARIALLQAAMREMWRETPYLWSLSITRSFGAIRSLNGLDYVPINWLNFAHAHV